AQPAHQRGAAGQDADLAVVQGQGHEVGRLVDDRPLRRDDDALQGPGCRCGRHGLAPFRLHALGLLGGLLDAADVLERLFGQVVPVSARGVTFPSLPVNAWATMNGCDRNFSTRRARCTTFLSSSDSSSTPRMEMMSCNSR